MPLLPQSPAKPATATVKVEQPEDMARNMATNLMRVIDALVVVMAEEIDLVEKRKQVEHAVLLSRKQQLTVDYRAGMKLLAAQPDIFKLLPDHLRAKLKASAQRLADVGERNARHLRGAVIATQRLVRTFVDLVREEVSVKSGYNNARSGNTMAGDYGQACKPIAINQTA